MGGSGSAGHPGRCRDCPHFTVGETEIHKARGVKIGAEGHSGSAGARPGALCFMIQELMFRTVSQRAGSMPGTLFTSPHSVLMPCLDCGYRPILQIATEGLRG